MRRGSYRRDFQPGFFKKKNISRGGAHALEKTVRSVAEARLWTFGVRRPIAGGPAAQAAARRPQSSGSAKKARWKGVLLLISAKKAGLDDHDHGGGERQGEGRLTSSGPRRARPGAATAIRDPRSDYDLRRAPPGRRAGRASARGQAGRALGPQAQRKGHPYDLAAQSFYNGEWMGERPGAPTTRRVCSRKLRGCQHGYERIDALAPMTPDRPS